MKGFGRAGLSALATSTLVIGACAAFVAPANADANFSFTRVDGHTRYDVSANVAGKYGKADHVILASGEQGKYGDALAANYLAGIWKSPVLLTQLNETPSATLAALKQAGATKITIVGGPLSVSPAQQASLEAAGYTVDRIQGTGADTSRYGTDAAVIKAADTNADTAIIATGDKFADALAAGPLAYAEGLPVGLVQLNNAPDAVIQALKDQGITKALVLGGDLSISQETRQKLNDAGIQVVAERELEGANRAQVATMLADYEITNYGFDNTRVNVATGRVFGDGADALSAGPLTGSEKRALLVTASDPKVGAAQATGQDLLNWLSNHAATLTGSDNWLFGGPLSISDAQKTLMENAAHTQSDRATYNVTSSSVEAGKNITGTITGDNIKSVSVAGPCVTNGPVTDSDTTTSGFQFSIPTNQNANAGKCTLTFTTTFNDGTSETDTQDVTITAPNSATTRPELVSAKIVSTTTPGQANSTNPQGTVVQYTFDEQVLSAPTVADYHLVTSGDTQATASSVLSVSGNTVTVRFNDLYGTTGTAVSNGVPTNVNDYTLATVAQGAAKDAQGQLNAEGDAPVGSAASSTTPATANTTAAPDLTGVSGFQEANTTSFPGYTAVNFTFDQNAYVLSTTGFHLVTLSGQVLNGTASNDPNAAGGGTIPGGSGTKTVTVVFPDITGTTPITAGDIARGYVSQGAVGDAATPTATNPLEAVTVSNGGITTDADLVSAQFLPNNTGSNTTNNDEVLYTFDQPVTGTPTAANFHVFKADGSQVPGSQIVTNTGSNTKQVLVSFTPTALTDAVGASVGTNTSANYEADSIGVTPVRASSSSQTPGAVDGPDLKSVAINTTTDPFGTKTSSATYTFDQAVNPATITASDFHLYLADGTELTATTCAPPAGASATTNTTVVCTAYNVVGGAAAKQAQIESATLGTVERGAVTGNAASANQNQNPIGAEFTTGGTGTPTR